MGQNGQTGSEQFLVLVKDSLQQAPEHFRNSTHQCCNSIQTRCHLKFILLDFFGYEKFVKTSWIPFSKNAIILAGRLQMIL